VKPIAKLTKRERAAILRDPNAKLSDLLEIAALDAIALQRQKRVKFDMWNSVEPPSRKGGKCTVCLAGAALYRDLGVRSEVTKWPEAVRNNFMRIDVARCGVDDPDISAAIARAWRQKLQRAPFRVYLTAARKLRELGL
jgi:hypothetical protein